MKREIHELIIGDCVRYIVRHKKHWWSKWQYLMDDYVPRLFTKEELFKFHLVPEPAQITLSFTELLKGLDEQIDFYKRSNSVNDYEKGCNNGAIAALEHVKDSLTSYVIKWALIGHWNPKES